MKIYYINLDRSSDRLENIHIQEEKINLKFDRIRAIDGYLLSHDERVKNCSLMGNLICTDSMIGCFLSHKKAWEAIANGPDEYGIVLEDDCILSKTFIKDVNKLLSEINYKEKNWDFIYLGYITLGLDLIKISTKLTHKTKNYHIPLQPLGFHCYMIRKKCARKMLKILNKIDYHVDFMFLIFEKNFNIFASTKTLGYQPSTCDNSTLNETKFPKLINSYIDSYNITRDNVSLSYHLSAPIIRLPYINLHINCYMIIFLIIWKKFKSLRNYIQLYFLYEIVSEQNIKDKNFIISWLLIMKFIK
jgi:GR25 family glycosyltransferase involved in LPS biosynthesis